MLADTTLAPADTAPMIAITPAALADTTKKIAGTGSSPAFSEPTSADGGTPIA